MAYRLNSKKVKMLMLDRGLEAKNLSEKAGLATAPLVTAINGKSKPRNETIKKIADVLGVAPADIVETDE